MAGQPGRLSATFNSLELGPRLRERSELKYFQTGLDRAENIDALPQGGFSVRAGTRHLGTTLATATRGLGFRANDGTVFDIVFGAASAQVWADGVLSDSFAHPYDEAQARTMDWTQQLDTLLTFHEDVAPQRVLYDPLTPDWTVAPAPLENVPLYDYGETYTNGVAAVWELEFVGFSGAGPPPVADIVFIVTLNNADTAAIKTQVTGGGAFDNAATAIEIAAALDALGLLDPGFTVAAHPSAAAKIVVTFSGGDNLGDIWALSGRVVNKADAAIVAFKTTPGVMPGEPVISEERGWPRCGVIYQQRLLMGGLRSLPSSWMASITGDYYNFDDRIKEANGPFLALLDAPGGEAVRRIVNNQFLLILTSDTNYWVAGSQDGLSKTAPPKHVPASDHGVAAGVPVVQNEGAAVYVHSSGDFIGELRYTDIDGNYKALDVSLLAYHLVSAVADMAVKKKENQQAANILAVLNGDGALRLCMMLREQDITGFARVESGCTFTTVWTNGRNELLCVAVREADGSPTRRIERFEPGLLLDAAIGVTNDPPSAIVPGLAVHEGAEVWAIADGDVFGPFTVTAGAITLPRPATQVTVGVWRPPVATTLPLPRERAEGVVVKRKGRIHSVLLDLEDTTSLALAANGGRSFDIDLSRYGAARADVAELEQGFTGTIRISGFTGWSDLPQLTITQHRPGRLTVRSITIEATL
jgi:hypothetical protein